jgi:ribosome modulation factor
VINPVRPEANVTGFTNFYEYAVQSSTDDEALWDHLQQRQEWVGGWALTTISRKRDPTW